MDLDDLLQKTSRTFALAIPLLPVVLRGADFGHPVVTADEVVAAVKKVTYR